MLAKEITERRKKLGLSQSALAREANLCTTTVNAAENGRLILYPGQEKKLRETFERLESASRA